MLLLWNSNPNTIELLISLYPNLKNDDHYLYTLSKLHCLNGNLNNAAELLLTALKIRFDKEYCYELASIYERMGNYAEAIRILKIVESGIPTLIKPKYQIAILYLKLNDMNNFKLKADEVISFKHKVGNTYASGLQRKMRYLLANSEALNFDLL